MVVVQTICSSLLCWFPSPVSVLAAGDGESSAAAAAAGASVLKMGRFQVGDAQLSWLLEQHPGLVPGAASSLCLVQGLWKQGWDAVSLQGRECPGCAGLQLWAQGFSVAFNAGMFTVLCPAGEEGPIWGCWFLGLILQVTHKCCFVWQRSAWREAVACFVAYLGNELFSPLRCILPLREIKAPR